MAGSNVGAVVTATANPNNYTFSHALSGTDAADFTIEESSGQIKVKSALDYETKTSYSVTVTVKAVQHRNKPGAMAMAASLDPNAPGDYNVPVTINVTDVEETPEFLDIGDPGNPGNVTRSVAENSAAGTNVGDPVTATDAEGETLYYTLTGADAAKFDIGETDGQITVADGTELDYESGTTSYSVTVNVSDKNDGSGNPDEVIDATMAVTISVTDVDEPPDKIPAPTLSRNADNPKTSLDAAWTRPDMTGKPDGWAVDVKYRQVGAKDWEAHKLDAKPSSELATTITGLAPGKTYEVQVRFRNLEGNADWSDSGEGQTEASDRHPRHRRERGGSRQRGRPGDGHGQPQQVHLQPRLERRGRGQVHHRIVQRPDKGSRRNRPGPRKRHEQLQRHRDGDRRRARPAGRGRQSRASVPTRPQLRHPGHHQRHRRGRAAGDARRAHGHRHGQLGRHHAQGVLDGPGT